MGACFGGWALDAFDVQMYSFVIPTVIALWGLSRGEAGLIGTVTLLISSLGGWFSRHARRPLRPGADAADHHPVVFGLHLPLRLRPEFRAALHPARAARLRLWRRMGGRRGADGRGDPRQVSRPRRRPGADRLGGRLGRLGAGLYRALLAPARGDRLARAVRGRPGAGGLCVLDPPPYRRAGDLSRQRAATAAGRLLASVLGVPRPASVDHGQGVADGRRRAGRRLCDRHLDADLSAHGARPVGDQHRRVFAGADPRRAVRLSARLLSERRDRPQTDLYAGRRSCRWCWCCSTCSCRWATRRCCSPGSR